MPRPPASHEAHAPPGTPSSGAHTEPDCTAQLPRPRVGLVIGSGGVKCAAAVGLWKVLVREGIPVDMVVGCSGGSIYAPPIALGFDVGWAEERTHVMWQGLFTRVHYPSVLRAVFPRLFGFHPRFGLVNDTAVQRVMQALYGEATFADACIPLYITATDLMTGEKVVLSEGRIADAVRASIAIPVLLRPWKVGDRLLIDGGASDPLPVSVAIREGCEIIIAMGFENPSYERFDSLTALAGQATSIMINNLLRSTYAFYSVVHHAEIIPVIPSFERRVRLKDTHLVPHLIEAGERATEAEIPYLRRLLAAGPRPADTPSAPVS